MAQDLSQLFARALSQHRFVPTPKRIRAVHRGVTIVDTRDALLVWEPGQIVPEYAVPTHALSDPHAGVAVDDPDLADHRLLRFDAFDTWLEEDERIFGHPRDPFHRVDVRKTKRRVRVELDGVVLAQSEAPTIMFETKLPPRLYFARAELHIDHFGPSTTRTVCAYKGTASYLSVRLGDRVAEDVAWSYVRPVDDAQRIAGLVSFYDDRVRIIDG